MTISLPPELQKLVDEKVREGPYSTAEELVRAALAHFLQYEESFDPGELDQLLAIGTAAISEGQVHPGHVVFDEIRKRSAERRAGNLP